MATTATTHATLTLAQAMMISSCMIWAGTPSIPRMTQCVTTVTVPPTAATTCPVMPTITASTATTTRVSSASLIATPQVLQCVTIVNLAITQVTQEATFLASVITASSCMTQVAQFLTSRRPQHVTTVTAPAETTHPAMLRPTSILTAIVTRPSPPFLMSTPSPSRILCKLTALWMCHHT